MKINQSVKYESLIEGYKCFIKGQFIEVEGNEGVFIGYGTINNKPVSGIFRVVFVEKAKLATTFKFAGSNDLVMHKEGLSATRMKAEATKIIKEVIRLEKESANINQRLTALKETSPRAKELVYNLNLLGQTEGQLLDSLKNYI